jgi:tetratricopeptide (TPR) repeat protein
VVIVLIVVTLLLAERYQPAASTPTASVPLVALVEDELMALVGQLTLPGVADSELTQRINQIIASKPDDSTDYMIRAGVHFLMRRYDLAGVDAEQSIELGAAVNMPYFWAVASALHRGQLVRAQTLFDSAGGQLPDPSAGGQMGEASAENPLSSLLAAFGHMILRQWPEVIASVDEALARGGELSDLYYMQGFALCNLGDYEAAAAAYTSGIEIEADYMALYALRAEVRRNLGDLAGALADTTTVLQSAVGGPFGPLLFASAIGQVTCDNLLDTDLAALIGSDP